MVKIIKKTHLLAHVIFGCFLIYLPSLLNFFSGDDWFHVRITQFLSFNQFLDVFSFTHTNQSAAFYRPIPTQVCFFVFQALFGLNAWPYHLFVLICFGYSLFLVYQFARKQFGYESKAILATAIYGLSVSNFTRIYFLSSFQEVALVIFSLLCLLSFPNSKVKSIIFFVIALLSKETAVILPLLILLFNFKIIKKNLASILPTVVILLIYLFLRFKVFGNTVGDSYLWNFSPAKAANTLMWYVLWSFGAPELLVDYVGSGLRLVPKFFTDYPLWWKIILALLFGTLATSSLLLLKRLKNIDSSFAKYVLLFLMTILPVLFLPAHKFSLELGLPLVGLSLCLAWLLPKKNTFLATIFFFFYIALNLSMNYLTYTRHYSVSRGAISLKVYDYFSKNYPIYPSGKYFQFINDSGDFGSQWGQSKQISQALSGSDFFKVFYKSSDKKVYYQDIPEVTPSNKSPIYLSTKQFLSQ